MQNVPGGLLNTPQGTFAMVLVHFLSLFLGFRVERALVRIGEKHDFYGAQAIADEYHREMMEAMKKKAPGSVVEVFAFFGGQ